MPYKDVTKRREYDIEYYYNNRERKLNYKKKYHEKNKELLNFKNKIYREKNKENIAKRKKIYNKEYWIKNGWRLKEENNIYYYQNIEKNRLKQKEYRTKNRKILNLYRKKLKQKNKGYRIGCYLRSRLWMILHKYVSMDKIMPSQKYGINYSLIIEHLKPFPQDLSKYHIDHIRPLCSFNFINPDGSTDINEVQIAFAPENHQWLKVEDNLSKGGKIETQQRLEL